MYPKYIEFTVAKMIFVFCSILSFQSFTTVNAQVQSDHNDFNFVAAGDWGCDKKAHETVANMQNKSPELVLALGDLSYQKRADCWFQMMSPLINKTKMVFGDHEYNFKNSSRLDEVLTEIQSNKTILFFRLW